MVHDIPHFHVHLEHLDSLEHLEHMGSLEHLVPWNTWNNCTKVTKQLPLGKTFLHHFPLFRNNFRQDKKTDLVIK